MKLIRRIFLTIATALLVGGVTAAIWLPGPQHMLCPGCHGLQRIAERTYVEATMPVRERQSMIAALDKARAKVVQFFGPLRSNPTVAICRSRACAQIFGAESAKGIAYGWHAILLSRSKIFGVIATHELAHIELHWRMGLWGWARGTVPAWFDEGLATVISEDPRFRRDTPAKDVREVVQVTSFLGDWATHSRRVGWRTAYGAASTRVRQLERIIGRDGLRRFVAQLARDGDLDGLFKRAASGKAFK